jgi:hypothetical protein
MEAVLLLHPAQEQRPLLLDQLFHPLSRAGKFMESIKLQVQLQQEEMLAFGAELSQQQHPLIKLHQYLVTQSHLLQQQFPQQHLLELKGLLSLLR